jgi:ABC-type antimicrobial peptide transport system permease subunit
MLVKFKKHKLALVIFWLLIVMYIIAVLADFIAPYTR